ncbi:MAG: hypothetical protein NVV59_06405 [Chitinophagaceae bacterium]|nr:hypothetical protein [Chitinophagaceae bacterium]
MQEHHQLLQTIYEIVKEDPQPESYNCRPRELILRQLQEWATIQEHLHALENEGLVRLEQRDTLIIQITSAGIDYVRSYEEEMISKKNGQ